MNTLAILVLITGSISLLSLLTLHFTSREFHPGWRMISEYALGKYKWLLTVFFLCWGICSLLSSALLWNIVNGFWPVIGIICLILTGVGAIMGGLFDVKHKLHGMAFGIGVPFLPLGVLLISYALTTEGIWADERFTILLSAHFIWISVVLMGISMALLFAGFKKAGVPFGPDIEAPKQLPADVIGINGYFNRLLVICYLAWPMLMAYLYWYENS
jgi:hypothetical protein